MVLQESPRWKRIEKLCFDGFDVFRNYAYANFKSDSYNVSMKMMMDDFEGTETEWSIFIDELTKGDHYGND